MAANRDVGARPRSRRCAAAGIRVSIFIDPDLAQVTRLAERRGRRDRDQHRRVRGRRTGRAAGAPRGGARTRPPRPRAPGLEVLAGHGLTYVNVGPIAAIDDIVELNIGHSIVARAALVGLDLAVREMIALME